MPLRTSANLFREISKQDYNRTQVWGVGVGRTESEAKLRPILHTRNDLQVSQTNSCRIFMDHHYSFHTNVPKGRVRTEATHVTTRWIQPTSSDAADSQIITGLPAAAGWFRGGFAALPMLSDQPYGSKTRRPIS